MTGSEWDIILDIFIAMILGGLIGLDREVADKPAGLRTHMLVAGASALLVELGQVSIEFFNFEVGSSYVQADPIRIIEAVITGVSFLGAGTIIRHRSSGETVEGLTTAASLLLASGVGIGVALSQYAISAAVTLMALVILRGIPWFVSFFRSR